VTSRVAVAPGDRLTGVETAIGAVSLAELGDEGSHPLRGLAPPRFRSWARALSTAERVLQSCRSRWRQARNLLAVPTQSPRSFRQCRSARYVNLLPREASSMARFAPHPGCGEEFVGFASACIAAARWRIFPPTSQAKRRPPHTARSLIIGAGFGFVQSASLRLIEMAQIERSRISVRHRPPTWLEASTHENLAIGRQMSPALRQDSRAAPITTMSARAAMALVQAPRTTAEPAANAADAERSRGASSSYHGFRRFAEPGEIKNRLELCRIPMCRVCQHSGESSDCPTSPA